MPSRAKTMLVAVKFRKKPVENMLPIVLAVNYIHLIGSFT